MVTAVRAVILVPPVRSVIPGNAVILVTRMPAIPSVQTNASIYPNFTSRSVVHAQQATVILIIKHPMAVNSIIQISVSAL